MNKTLIKELSYAALIYLACTVAFFWPTFTHFSHALIGPPEDNMQFYWFMWYGPKAILDPALSFMKTHFIYYPEGQSLYYANYYYYGVFWALVLKPLFNLTQIFNLMVLHSFVLAGVGAFLLIRDITKNFYAALLGGFIFAFNPSHFAHALHHVTISSIQFIPFFVWMSWKSFREGKLRYIFLCALFLTLSAFCDWNYLIYGVIFLSGYYFYEAIRSRQFFPKNPLKTVVITGIVSFLSLSWLLIPMIRIGLKKQTMMDLPGHDLFVADLLGFFVPPGAHLLGNVPALSALTAKMTGTDWEKAVYLGWANIFLMIALMIHSGKKQARYYGAFFIFCILALGVRLHVLGNSLPVYLPYKILQELPFFTNARNPSRTMVFSYLFLAILVSAAFKVFFLDGRTSFKKNILAVFLSLFIFLDYYSVCAAVTPVKLPRGYEVIQKDKDGFAVLEIPWDAGRYMMYQTLYDKPSVQGYLGRKTEASLLARLHFNMRDLPIQKRELTENKVKYIVLFKKRMNWDADKVYDATYFSSFERVSNMYASLYEKAFEDDSTSVFKVY